MSAGKRLQMTLCPACGGAVIKGDTHGPEDDLRAIRERDRAYNTGTGGLGLLTGNLAEQPTGRLQMAADRRMLLRMLDAELAAPEGPRTTVNVGQVAYLTPQGLRQAALDYLANDGSSGTYDARAMREARERLRAALADTTGTPAVTQWDYDVSSTECRCGALGSETHATDCSVITGQADHAPGCDVFRIAESWEPYGVPRRCDCGFIPPHHWDDTVRQWVPDTTETPEL